MVPFARPTSIGPPGHCNLDKKGVAAAGGALQLKRLTGILLYCWWNIWKERNMRILDSVYKNELPLSTKEDIELYHQAFRDPK
jgi:hypothetical protein